MLKLKSPRLLPNTASFEQRFYDIETSIYELVFRDFFFPSALESFFPQREKYEQNKRMSLTMHSYAASWLSAVVSKVLKNPVSAASIA